MRTVAIIQCRMNSSRLPGKVMMKFGNETIIEFMVNRVRGSKWVDDVVIATTTNPMDDAIEKLCIEKEILFYRGSEENVIQRVLDAADHYEAELIVDLTGDCCFADPLMIDDLINILLDDGYDYISNDIIERSFADGIDIQIFKRKILEETIPLITNPKHFSHSGWNIPTYSNGKFSIGNIKAEHKYDMPQLGLTLDEEKDYQFLLSLWKIFSNEKQYKQPFDIYDMLDYIIDHPECVTNREVRRKVPGNG